MRRCARGALSKPVLYLSHYFKQHRQEYYARIQAVRDRGDRESWLIFMLSAFSKSWGRRRRPRAKLSPCARRIEI
jgi:Fic family protein